MKNKPLLITILCLMVAFVCIFFFVKAKYFKKANAYEIVQFVKDFGNELKGGNIDSMRNYFEGKGNTKIALLIKALSNKTSLGSKKTPDFNTTLDADNATILMSNSDIAVVKVPVIFSHDNFDSKTTYITFTIRRIAEHQYKFIKIKAETFAKDYMAYKTKIDEEFAPPKPVEYSPQTLAAFKTAETLKGKYDSVVWFQHIGKQTYFYVLNGKLKDGWEALESQILNDSAKTYKLGLLGPDLKEIIPVQYDLIHNINGTFKGLIEVDKDQKHGFYNTDGKLVVPVEYNQIFPVNDGTHIAAMRINNDYYWLNKDYTISDKADIKIADILSQIRNNIKFEFDPHDINIIEHNSHLEHSSIYIAPSYLADLNIMGTIETFKNPLRKNTESEDASTSYNVDLDHTSITDSGSNAFETLVYDVKNHFIGGRVDLYEKKSLIVLDKQHNRLLSHDIYITGNEGDLPSKCSDYSLRMLSDSLIEVKVTASMTIDIPTDTTTNEILNEAPVYHYFKIAGNKLIELRTNRNFSFTKFIKMDDSYLRGCYNYFTYNGNKIPPKQLQTNYLQPKYYQYVINEIYADYHYKFKNTKWNDGFQNEGGLANYKPENENIDDSLTAIDKYNINFIKQKMATTKPGRLAMK